MRQILKIGGTENSVTTKDVVVELNDNNKISFRVMNEKEDLERRNKSAEGMASFFEPMQIFRRNMNRDTYALSYTGKEGKADWKLDVNYGKMKENDTTLTTYYGSGHDQYGGKNTLAAVDWLKHKQLDVNATLNVAANDQHFLTYGVGYTDERANGTRLKNAPKQWTKGIDPWDYDKSLWIPSGSTEPDSAVHNYLFKQNENGLVWDKSTEYYGGDVPIFTAEDAAKIKVLAPYLGFLGSSAIGMDLTEYGVNWKGDADLQKRFETFNQELKDTNDLSNSNYTYRMLPALGYYGSIINVSNYGQDKNIKYNGKYYGEDFDARANQVSGGEVRLQRRHAFVQDTWQVNDNTILTPIIRFDNSDLFGSEVTANLGMTHNLNGNPHRRLKANVGTGYTEPGMGELYYNWEMFGSAGGSRYGWYWIGNPNLKPEKSFNMDISLEGENNKTYSRVSLFHNQIDDYMTSYFIGQLIDFNQFGSSTVTNADRIYSYKNLGKAEITGIEAEVQQKFNDHWSAKLGYAWLHAINKSDPDMPRQLLDRPQHKVDISLNYEDKANGWRAALWGDYYIHMLDSNSVNTNDLFDKDSNGNYIRKKAEYKKKTFGIWNFMVQKDFGKDMTAYVGIDNLFNHRDDDRAYQDRLYRIGANIKFGTDADTAKEAAAKEVKASATAESTTNTTVTATGNGTSDGVVTAKNENGDWFLTKPSDKDAGRKVGDVELIGDYRVRSNMFHGQNLPALTLTTTTDLDAGATKNMADASGHGLEQRLRLGVDYQIGDDTNFLIQGSSGNTLDTMYSKSDKRGLHDARLDRAELNQKANKWDFTIGRLTERMGVTGYWFGKEYDGIRATYTNDKTQVRLGYGDFSASTGITDSAYTHTEKALISRPPTLAELLGVYPGIVLGIEHPGGSQTVYPEGTSADAWKTTAMNYYEKWNHAGQIQQADGTWVKDTSKSDYDVAVERWQVLSDLNQQLIKVAEMYPTDSVGGYGGNWYMKYFQTLTDPNQRLPEYPTVDGNTGEVIDPNNKWTGTNPSNSYNRFISVPVLVNGVVQSKRISVSTLRTQYGLDDKSWGEMLDPTTGKEEINKYLHSVYDGVTKYYQDEGKGSTPFVDDNGNALSEDDAIKSLFTNFVGTRINSFSNSTSCLNAFFYYARTKFDPFNGSETPVSALDSIVKVQGTLLKQDVIPSIDRAAFVQVRQKISDDLGLTAWYLRSMGDGYHKTGLEYTDAGWGNYDQEMDIANIFGLGAQYRLGALTLSFDWGINRSDTGRYFHGGRDEYGRYTGDGSNPTFWVLRADIGKSDTDVVGSWNAFADYKYFEHGSFFGGNGTEALPDRYLDGIRSFTLGAGYVPAKNFLLEAFYTFGAQSTQKRGTLYGSEDFTLGDYTRVQVSYKF